MKYFRLIFCFLLFAFSSKAQDLIIKTSGDTLTVSILKTTPEIVEYKFISNDVIHQDFKSNISQIIYSNGQKESFNTNKTKLPIIKGPDDWEKVLVTENKSDVEGLTEVCKMEKHSTLGGTLKQLGINGIIKKMKKEAAKKGGRIIYIVDPYKNKIYANTMLYGTVYK